jgi:RNA polymerase sigma-70 factor (ECF subfamily)
LETLSDKQLVERMCAGDGRGFDELFARHEPAVRQRALAVLRDHAAADDVAQEVFLRLWTRAEQWNGQGPLGPWLMRITENLARNHLRTVRRRRQQPLEGPAAAPDGGDTPPPGRWMIDEEADDPPELAGLAERNELLWQLVDSLAPDKGQVLRLVHQRELGIRQAAEELGIPQGTVKSRLHYAIKELSELLHEMGADWENP